MNLDYIAGLFDGEGSIFLSVMRTQTSPWGWTFRPYVSIANNSRQLLDDVQRYFGFGRIVRQKGGCYSWSIRPQDDVARFIDAMENHVYLKHQQFLLMREALRCFPRKKSWRNHTSRGCMLALVQYCARIRELNRRFNVRQKKSGTDLYVVRSAIEAVSDDRITQIDRRRHERAARTHHTRFLERLAQTPRGKIENLYRHSSLTVPEIGRELGLTRRILYETLRFYGIDRDGRKDARICRGRPHKDDHSVLGTAGPLKTSLATSPIAVHGEQPIFLQRC